MGQSNSHESNTERLQTIKAYYEKDMLQMNKLLLDKKKELHEIRLKHETLHNKINDESYKLSEYIKKEDTFWKQIKDEFVTEFMENNNAEFIDDSFEMKMLQSFVNYIHTKRYET